MALHSPSAPIALHGGGYAPVKRAVDLILAVVVLVPCLAAMLLIALAIRLDSPGPIVFSQLRTGQDGRRFRMLKFRTMVRDAERLKAELAHLNVLQPPDFKIPNDPRITIVGRFLRRTHLDELPQLWNVLVGDMSLVGPRPTSFAAETYRLWHTERLDARPGVTGLWQIRGRAFTEFDDRLRLDIRYIDELSLVNDLKIILLTFKAIVTGTGA
jgi:lipopolysaccharide/colanic/teichoic acid biosynthesis glycosyltransferase